jgi:hypothetical protein
MAQIIADGTAEDLDRMFRIETPALPASRRWVHRNGIGESESGAKTARRGRLALPWQPFPHWVGRTVSGEPGCHPQRNPFLLILVFPPEGGTTNHRNLLCALCVLGEKPAVRIGVCVPFAPLATLALWDRRIRLQFGWPAFSGVKNPELPRCGKSFPHRGSSGFLPR